MKNLILGCSRAITLAALILTAACDGQPVERENAVAYFREHRPAFERIVAQVERCQPPHGRLRAGNVRCSNRNANGADLAAAITAANAQWVYVSRAGDEARSLAAVRIAIHATGVAFSGVIEEFVYEAAAAPEAEYQRTDNGIAIRESMPVTDAPHHWYWRKIDR